MIKEKTKISNGVNKKIEIEKLNKKIRNCSKCPLWRKRSNVVPGEGPVNAKIIFIGEAPGREEDKTGKPFCGRAGKLLDKLFKDNNIKRETVFITSVIKCRPPKNRRPKKKELERCHNWWQKQIEIINPQKIVILGKTAFDAVINLGELNDCRGRWLKIKNSFYLPTYHPAAGLRFPKIKKILEKDFRKLKKFRTF